MNKRDSKKKVIDGRTKGTSAFNIKQAEELDEISWSNNKFESTITKDKE